MTGKPGKTRSPAKEKETKENNWTRKIFGVRRRRRTQKDNIRRGKSDDEQKETSGMEVASCYMLLTLLTLLTLLILIYTVDTQSWNLSMPSLPAAV